MNLETALSLVISAPDGPVPFQSTTAKAECATVVAETCDTEDQARQLIGSLAQLTRWPGIPAARQIATHVLDRDPHADWHRAPSVWNAPAQHLPERLAIVWRRIRKLPCEDRAALQKRAGDTLFRLADHPGFRRILRQPHLLPNLQHAIIDLYQQQQQAAQIIEKLGLSANPFDSADPLDHQMARDAFAQLTTLSESELDRLRKEAITRLCAVMQCDREAFGGQKTEKLIRLTMTSILIERQVAAA